jgi:HTH-type transcriptional regulator/antitoxin HipB
MLSRSPQELAQLVIKQRKKLKLSQAAIADLVGLKQKTISAFENKPEGTKLDTLFLILSAVQLDIRVAAKKSNETAERQWQQEW